MQVVPLYCFDPRNFVATPWNNPKTGAFRAQFLIESVADLKRSLQQMGSDLMVHMGTPEEAVRGKPPSQTYCLQTAMGVTLRLCDPLDCQEWRVVVLASLAHLIHVVLAWMYDKRWVVHTTIRASCSAVRYLHTAASVLSAEQCCTGNAL